MEYLIRELGEEKVKVIRFYEEELMNRTVDADAFLKDFQAFIDHYTRKQGIYLHEIDRSMSIYQIFPQEEARITHSDTKVEYMLKVPKWVSEKSLETMKRAFEEELKIMVKYRRIDWGVEGNGRRGYQMVDV